MSKAWQFVKVRPHWVYLAVMIALAGWSLLNGDVGSALVIAGIAVVAFALLSWLNTRTPAQAPPLTFEQGEIETLRKKGLEPVPIPGEIYTHDPENCPFCEVIE